ncbi:MAG: hypothetical protein OXF29_02920 [Hyphomicrobiales bacterium]|nr:hypothetical protein [Hyphomicrobiales bacterium]
MREDEVAYQNLPAGFIGEFHNARKPPGDKRISRKEAKTAYSSGQKPARKPRTEGFRIKNLPKTTHNFLFLIDGLESFGIMGLLAGRYFPLPLTSYHFFK